MSVDRKDAIIEALEQLRKKEVADKQPYKARAYINVLKQVKALPGAIRSWSDLSGVTGIGEKIKQKITEILETGSLKSLEGITSNPHYEIMDSLMGIHGIGPAKAQQLVQEHNIRSIDDLKQKQDVLLNEKQRMGLKYHEDTQIRIPRKEMLKHEEYIKSVFSKNEKSYIVELVGSYRRGESSSGDIDVLITHPDSTLDHEKMFQSIIQTFKEDKYVVDIFAQGGKKCLAVCKAKRHKYFRRIDFMMTSKHEFPFALLYFTGSGPFNVEMRNWAIEKGYSLSEYGLKYLNGPKKGEFVDTHFENEEQVFEFLDLKYIPPHQRTANAFAC